MVKQYTKGKAIKISENFKSTEFDCKCKRSDCKKTLIDEGLIEIVQMIRTHFGNAEVINSGYRCEAHNKSVGGASKSKHVSGEAADIVVKNIKPAEVAKYAETIGVKGIGLYEGSDGNFVHVDTRTEKAFWYGHKQEKRTTFGGTPEPSTSELKARIQSLEKENTSLVAENNELKSKISNAKKALG